MLQGGLMNNLYAAATPISLKEKHAKQQPAGKKQTQQQMKVSIYRFSCTSDDIAMSPSTAAYGYDC
jgi:hypothetical protein